jgi:hypothetical protein
MVLETITTFPGKMPPFVSVSCTGICGEEEFQMSAIEGLFLKFLDDSLGHDRPDALDETGPYISLNASH